MNNAFHDYIAGQIVGYLKKRRVLVWFDPSREFEPFVAELANGQAATNANLLDVSADGIGFRLCQYAGSYFEVRFAVEPFVSADRPEPLLIYVPGVKRERENSVLMELELAGERWEPKLKSLARNVLRQRLTDGVIDEFLAPEKVTYEDVVALLNQGGSGEGGGDASMLKVIFQGCREWHDILARWIADERLDASIEAKESTPELLKLIETRLGLKLEESTDLPTARARVVRYTLVNEFRSDFAGDPPSSISMIPECLGNEFVARVKEVARNLRNSHRQAYVPLADKVEVDLGLTHADFNPEHLGNIDTFRFEEGLLLGHCGALILQGKLDEASMIVSERSNSFWIMNEFARKQQWEACRLLVELAREIQRVEQQLKKPPADAAGWTRAYGSESGWCLVDHVYRALETSLSAMDADFEAEQALGLIRRKYEDLLHLMAVGFQAVLASGEWTAPGILHQTKIYPEVVARGSGCTAYFLIDALRFEMGLELKRQMEGADELAIEPAVAALPTITPVGMAALLPGASASFNVTSEKFGLAVSIEGSVLANSNDRMRFLKSQVPGVVEATLDKVLQTSPQKLKGMIGQGSLFVVRSQEIDKLGENGGDLIARQVMDMVIPNLIRAIRRLSAAGVERFVLVADHGYQHSLPKEEHQRMENPGGETLECHRRVWIGRGGSNLPAATRVSANELGYDSDLEFVFPNGIGVLTVGGGLCYHHGGISLQEVVIPVVTLRLGAKTTKSTHGVTVKIDEYAKVITNRIFQLKVVLETDIFVTEPVKLKLVLVSGSEIVGQAGMGIGADVEQTSGKVVMKPNSEATIAMILSNEQHKSVKIVAQEEGTDATLFQSEELTVKLGI